MLQLTNIDITAQLLYLQPTINIKDVAKHIGETITVCDSVYTTRALPNLTLINLGAEFPKHLLTVLSTKPIWISSWSQKKPI